jgi:hypothetical protein
VARGSAYDGSMNLDGLSSWMRQALDAVGAKPEQLYGCGGFSCVVDDGPGMVFKVTADGSEAFFAVAQRGLGLNLPGIVTFVKVANVELARRVWVLERQEVTMPNLWAWAREASPSLEPGERISAWARRMQSHETAEAELLSEAQQCGLAVASVMWDVATKGGGVPEFLARIKPHEKWAAEHFAPKKSGISWYYGDDRHNGQDQVAAVRLLGFRFHLEKLAAGRLCPELAKALLRWLDEGIMLCDVNPDNVARDESGVWTLYDCGFAVPMAEGWNEAWKAVGADPTVWWNRWEVLDELEKGARPNPAGRRCWSPGGVYETWIDERDRAKISPATLIGTCAEVYRRANYPLSSVGQIRVPPRSGVYEMAIEDLDGVAAGIWDPRRAVRIRDAYANEIKLRPISVTVTYDGNVVLGDGNHRLSVARELGPAKVPTMQVEWELETRPGRYDYDQPNPAQVPEYLRSMMHWSYIDFVRDARRRGYTTRQARRIATQAIWQQHRVQFTKPKTGWGKASTEIVWFIDGGDAAMLFFQGRRYRFYSALTRRGQQLGPEQRSQAAAFAFAEKNGWVMATR